jgi:hypothetical protein
VQVSRLAQVLVRQLSGLQQASEPVWQQRLAQLTLRRLEQESRLVRRALWRLAQLALPRRALSWPELRLERWMA